MLRRSFLFGAAAALAAQEPANDSANLSANLGAVAWVHDRALWVRSLPRGTPRAVATGAALYKPRFSPSGRWILFRDGEDCLGLASADGARSKCWAAPLPDSGRWLAGDRLVIDQTTVLSEGDGWNAPVMQYADPVGTISPDGRQHAWVSEREGENTRLLVGAFGAAGEPKLVAETKEGGFEIFSFIRGGSRFLYWATDEEGASVWSYGMNIQIGGGEQPVDTGICTLVADAWARMVALSPTADVLAAAVGGDHLMYQEHQLVLADVSADAKSPVVPITGPSVHVLQPSWSPDGQRLAWSQGPDANVVGPQMMEREEHFTWEKVWDRCIRARRIWSAGGRGLAKPVQLTNDSRYRDENPLWSRDGKHILFERTDEKETVTLWLMRADGSEPREVAGPLATTPEFSDLPLFDWSLAG
jgi:dipeptidyl aminopeptidase/acylaminoacyl peptidase